MSNTIEKYRKEVKLIQAVLGKVNVTQSDRVGRIYHNAFELCVLSDQDFFEAINWYARKVVRIAAERSLRSSRKMDIGAVRFWSSVIIYITPLIGDHPFFELNSMIVHVDDMP